MVEFVPIGPEPIDRYRPLIGESEFERLRRIADEARERFAGRAIWHVNSTAHGGGVAEILHSQLPYVRAVGIDTRWVVVSGNPEFFAVTKRIHNLLHDSPGDGGPLGAEERRVYEESLVGCAEELGELVQPDDIVYLHDPQTVGLVPPLHRRGAKVVWRCHIGVDDGGPLMRLAWDFLRPYLADADAYVFSREEYVWEGLDRGRAWLVPPSIDAFTPKNQELEPATVKAILRVIGLLEDGLRHPPAFTRGDGTPGRVERQAEILQEAPCPENCPMVTQVSRWDRLKDPAGLIECFDRHLDRPGVHLVLAGPVTDAVSDDPEGAAVYEEVTELWRRLEPERRRRAHLVSLPMDDLDENGAMVNALQRRSDVLVQKSIAEGFGLVVAEGMWKARPFVGSRVGGIQDQIVHGESGILVDDPRDLPAFAAAIEGLLEDEERAAELGRAARERVRERFLAIGRLGDYVELLTALIR